MKSMWKLAASSLAALGVQADTVAPMRDMAAGAGLCK